MMTSTKNKYLILFAFCKVVKGTDRSIICDFQKEKIKFIPNEMGSVIDMFKDKTYDNVKMYFEEDKEIFESYVDFLIDEGFAFFSSSRDNFVEIENEWSSPEIINNAIIEYNFENYDLINVFKQLDILLVKFIELRFVSFQEDNSELLSNLLEFCNKSVLRSIRIFIPYSLKELSKSIIHLVKDYPIVDCIIFYGCSSNKFIEKDTQQIFYISQNLDEINTANIDKKFLINNIDYYHECQKYNPYYNKKVTINISGEIKNCIKNRAIFGNVKEDTIESIIKKKDFQEFWFVTHDQILDIQNSELRYNYIITNDMEKISNERFKIIT